MNQFAGKGGKRGVCPLPAGAWRAALLAPPERFAGKSLNVKMPWQHFNFEIMRPMWNVAALQGVVLYGPQSSSNAISPAQGVTILKKSGKNQAGEQGKRGNYKHYFYQMPF